MIRIKNTAEDRTKSLLHRTAAKFELEPMLGDQRIRLRSYIDITEEHYERVKHIVAPWVAAGMVEVLGVAAVEEKAPLVTEVVAPAPAPAPVEQLDMIDDTPPVEESIVATPEPAGAPVVVEAPPAPVAEEKPTDNKKGPGGKKKLF